jgi:hypothetical protein
MCTDYYLNGRISNRLFWMELYIMEKVEVISAVEVQESEVVLV